MPVDGTGDHRRAALTAEANLTIDPRRDPVAFRERLGLGVVVVAASVLVGAVASVAPDAVWGVAVGGGIWLTVTMVVLRQLRRQADAAFLTGIVLLGVIARVISTFAQLAIAFWFYRGEVDFVDYSSFAQALLIDAMSRDPIHAVARFIDAMPSLSWVVTTALTASMMTVTGPSFAGLALVSAALSSVGAFLFLRAYQLACPAPASHRVVAGLLFLFPSLAFWTVLLGKDSWMCLLSGWLAYSLARVLTRLDWPGVLGGLVSLAGIFTIRPYLALTLVLSVAVTLSLKRLGWRGPAAYLLPIARPLVWIGAAGLLVFVVMRMPGALGIETLSLDVVSDLAVERHQASSATTTGSGSSLPVALESARPGDLLAYLPVALLALFLRPFPWEAHNALAVIAALENVALLLLVLGRVRPFVRALGSTGRQPLMLFALVALTTTSILVSFEWNLGASNRHRAMALPYLFLLLGSPSRDR